MMNCVVFSRRRSTSISKIGLLPKSRNNGKYSPVKLKLSVVSLLSLAGCAALDSAGNSDQPPNSLTKLRNSGMKPRASIAATSIQDLKNDRDRFKPRLGGSFGLVKSYKMG